MLFRVVIVLSALLFSFPAFAERKVALLIGNASYSGVATTLRNPPNDIAAMRAMLAGAAFEVTVVENSTRSDMSSALAAFEETSRGADVGLIYYSGHGMEIGGTNYLLPVDVKLASDRDVKYEAIALDDLMLSLGGVTRLKLVLLDACRDNPFLTAMKRLATKGIPTRGLARVDTAESNLLVGYATAPGDVALDGDGENSPYASALVRHLVEPGVEIETALRAVAKDVFEATGGKQRPFKTGSLFETVMLGPIAEIAVPAVKDQISADPCRDAATHWTEIKGRKDKTLLEEHIRLFGSCAFASLARQEIATLDAASRSVPEMDCDRLAAAPIDPFKLASVGGVGFDDLDGPRSVAACKEAREQFPQEKRFFFQYARALDRDGNHQAALQEYMRAADVGHAFAMRNIGNIYAFGKGVEKNPTEAMIWYKKAAELGDTGAVNLVGLVYQSAGGPQNMSEATNWFRQAANAGNVEGMFNLAFAVQQGGRPENFQEALGWYQKAAGAGHAQAISNLGVFYERGYAVPRNLDEALNLYTKAADLGNAYGEKNLASLLDKRGNPQDRAEAARRIEGALRHGHEPSLQEMTKNANNWSPEFRRQMQQRLQQAGVYDGPADGRFGRSTIAAIEAIYGKKSN